MKQILLGAFFAGFWLLLGFISIDLLMWVLMAPLAVFGLYLIGELLRLGYRDYKEYWAKK